MYGSADVPVAPARRRGRVVVAGCLLVLLCAAVAWIGSSPPEESEPKTPVEPALTTESQRRQMIEGLVASIEAHSRDTDAGATVQAPPARRVGPSPSDSPTGAAQRRPPPDGYAHPTFERAGMPTKSPDTGDKEVRSPVLDWLSSPESLAGVAANAEAAGRDWSFGWLRLGADARLEDATAALTALGVVVEGQAGGLVRVRLPGDAGRLQAVAELAVVDGLGAQPPSAKLTAAFAAEARDKPPREVVPVFVTLSAAGDDEGRWRAELERLGAVVGAYDAHTRSYVANVEYGGLDALAAADFVAFVEPVGIVEAANDTAAPAMGADAYRSYTDDGGWGGTAGAGVAVGVMDSGLNINHVDIETGRLSVCGANFYPSLAEEQDLWVDAGLHGTHVTATIAGNGAAERRYAGMAPLVPHIRFAKVLSSRGFGFNSSIFPGMDYLARPSSCEASGWTDDAVAPPIVNMSLSWTTRTWEGRDAAARKLDAVVWDTGQLYVVANSNADIHGFSNYGAAKNSLPVGAAWDSGELASFSSHGPTADGRIAPLIVGTGVNVYSARGGGSRGAYVRFNGTSMSSPSVAGVAALVMDAQPTFAGNAALARAHLMASAVKPGAWLDAADAFPSNNTDGPGTLHARYGLGKVSGTTSVFDRPRDDGWESGGWHGIRPDTGESWDDVIEVPPGATRLDVVLTWDEPPADVIANTVLNDLDLWLEQPVPYHEADLSSRSRRDNVEWIIVDNPRAGRWRPRVVAERVHGDKPRAALAYTIIRGPATPQLSIVAADDTLDADGDVELTVSTEGYVAAGTRLVMDCRTEDGDPCRVGGTYEDVREGAPATDSRFVAPGSFIALGEIRAGEPRTLRFRGLTPGGNARVHFTVTGWNAKGASTVVFAAEAEETEFVAPDNDDFAAAADLADAVEGDLLTATTEPGEPAFEDGSERPAASVWYRWKAKAAGPVHFSLAPAEAFRYSPQDDLYDEFEIRIDVYQGGSVADVRKVASAAWGASFVAEQDSEYLVRVAGRARAAPFALNWREGGAPGNDAFDAAVALEGGEGQVKGTNAGATLESGEQFGPLAATVWYEWTAPDDGWYEFGSSAAHLKVLAFRDATAVHDLRLVSGFPEEDIRFPAKAGDAYRVAVAARDAEAAGTDFVLSWAALEEHESSNDLLENASPFPEAESYIGWVGVESFQTVEPGEPDETGVRTEWISWTPPAQGEYTWRLDTDTLRLTAFKGDALDVLVPVGSNDGPTGEFSFAADEGEQYRISVAVAHQHAFTVRSWGGNLVWGPTPSNDAWSQAAVLDTAGGTFAASNRYATIETGERIYDIGHSSLWWAFEAPEPGWYRFWIGEASLPFTISAYAHDPDAPPGGLDLIASSERGIVAGIEIYLEAKEAGERFAVRVGTRGNAVGQDFTLNWEESDGPVWLRYLGRTIEDREYVDDDGESVRLAGFRSLALDDAGLALYADIAERGLAVFERSPDNGSIDFRTLIVRDGWPSALFWDQPRNRLLGFEGCTVHSYTPVGGDVRSVEYQEEVPVAGESCVHHTSRFFANGANLYVFGRDLKVFSFEEDGALTHIQTIPEHYRRGTVSNAGDHVYIVDSVGTLRALERGETGEFVEVASVSTPYVHEYVSISHDDSLVFMWGVGQAAVVDVADPRQPTLLDRLDLPRDRWYRPYCRIAMGRNARLAADAFCSSAGGAYALEWTGERLVVRDVVAGWHPSRYNDLVPSWSWLDGFAATTDGRHVYTSARDDGIFVFERVANEVPDDHADSRDAATPIASLPWSGEGELEWAGDRDVFRIALERPGMLAIRTTGSTDTYGKLTNAVGDVLVEDDESGGAPNFEIKADVEAGTYYVEVSGGAGGGATGPYELSIEFVADEGGVVFAAERVITTDASGPVSLYAADLDGDGDADLVSASTADNKIAWHENLGGGEFSAQRVVTKVAEGANSVHAADLDGDGDPDLLSASPDDDKIGWYENLGDGEFSAQRIVTTDADGAFSVHASDLDGDGDADILSASWYDQEIAWYENTNGGFSEQRVIATDIDGAPSVLAADLDADGDADIVTASRDDDKIAWHENLGGGAFSDQRVITTDADGAAHVHAADVDGDGDPDLLSASLWDDKVAWYENLGGGAFSRQRIVTTDADGAAHVHAADLNGDGNMDVMSASLYDDEVAWYENLGESTFSMQRVITSDADAAGSVHAADLDGDGDADVLAASSNDDKIAWFENHSDHGDDHGDLDKSATLATALPAFLHGVLESDDDNDVFRFATGSGTLKVYANGPTNTYGWLLDAEGDFLAGDDPSSGNFLIEAEVEAGVHYVDVFGPDDATGPYTVSIEFVFADDHGSDPETATPVASLPFSGAGELEREGDRDVFRIDLDESGTLTVYTTGDTDTVGKLTDADGDVVAEDDDAGDGSNFEIEAAVESGTHYVEVSGAGGEATGSYTLVIEFAADAPSVVFAAERVIHPGDSGLPSSGRIGDRSVRAADLDGDGNPDVLSAHDRADKVAWHENLDGGEFSGQRVISTANGALSVDAPDLDGDGDADVLSASFGDDRVAWHENYGGGEFSSQHVISTAGWIRYSVHAADLDGDGDGDVLSAAAGDNEIAWHENLGDGEFSAKRVITTDAEFAKSVHAADLDGDGDADVLSASLSDDKIAWYENLGGQFSSQRVISTEADGAGSVYATDLDGDGDADVLSASSIDDKIAWYENLGGGEFSSQRVITTDADGAVSVYGADLDGDRDIDVLSASERDYKIAWYENLGGGGFSSQQVVSTDVRQAGSVYAADLDGDGDADILSFAWGNDEVAWYENLSDHGDDHGDVPDTATLAATLPALLLGKVESSGDKDVFRIATAGGTLNVKSLGPTDTLGRLLDADGGELARNDDSDGLNFGITAQVTAGVHYVEVGGFSTRTGPYTLSIEFVAD